MNTQYRLSCCSLRVGVAVWVFSYRSSRGTDRPQRPRDETQKSDSQEPDVDLVQYIMYVVLPLFSQWRFDVTPNKKTAEVLSPMLTCNLTCIMSPGSVDTLDYTPVPTSAAPSTPVRVPFRGGTMGAGACLPCCGVMDHLSNRFCADQAVDDGQS